MKQGEQKRPGGRSAFANKQIRLREYPAESNAAPFEKQDAQEEKHRECLADFVYRKAKQEFQSFINSLKAEPTLDEVIRGSHEADIKEYLVGALHCGDCSLQQLQALAKLPKPLQALYEYWEEERDDPLIWESLDCVQELCDSLLKRQKARGTPARDERGDK